MDIGHIIKASELSRRVSSLLKPQGTHQAIKTKQLRKARTEALLSTSRGGQKLLGQNDSTHDAQLSRDST